MSFTTDRAPRELAVFRVDLHAERDVIRVAPVGDLDAAHAGILGAELTELHAAGFTKLVLDLRDVDAIDATAIALLLAETYLAEATGSEFSLIAGSPAIQRCLQLAGVVERLAFRTSASR